MLMQRAGAEWVHRSRIHTHTHTPLLHHGRRHRDVGQYVQHAAAQQTAAERTAAERTAAERAAAERTAAK